MPNIETSEGFIVDEEGTVLGCSLHDRCAMIHVMSDEEPHTVAPATVVVGPDDVLVLRGSFDEDDMREIGLIAQMVGLADRIWMIDNSIDLYVVER